MKRLVLLGGGHSHVEVLRRFGVDPLPGAELVLVSPYPDAVYSGMLPGWIAGHYTRDECHIDLVRLTSFAHCRFVRSACTGIDPEARLVTCADGTTLPYRRRRGWIPARNRRCWARPARPSMRCP